MQADVKTNSQNNGFEMAKFRPPHHGSKTCEQILMKLGIYHYIVGITTHANPHGAATTWVVLANM